MEQASSSPPRSRETSGLPRMLGSAWHPVFSIPARGPFSSAKLLPYTVFDYTALHTYCAWGRVWPGTTEGLPWLGSQGLTVSDSEAAPWDWRGKVEEPHQDPTQDRSQAERTQTVSGPQWADRGHVNGIFITANTLGLFWWG